MLLNFDAFKGILYTYYLYTLCIVDLQYVLKF